MIPRWQYIVFNLTLLLAWCSAKPQARVLTLFDDIKQADQVTQFLQDVEGLGFEIEKRSTTDPELHLRSWDDWRYEKLIIFSSGSKAFGGAIDNEAILDFVDSGRGLILAVDSKVSDDLRNLASDLGVDFEPKGSAVLDPANHVTKPRSKDGHIIISRQIADEPYIIGQSSIQDPILFRGIGSTFSPETQQVVQLLGGESSQYMGRPGESFTEELQAVGKAISLVSVVQTLNDARVLISGSQDLFSDGFYGTKDITTKQGQTSPQTGNREFVKQLATWTFGQRSVLKASELRHRTANSTETPAVYRITDYIDFELDIQEYSHGKWGPFKASDVQLEFTMLDPHIRTFLRHDGKGKFYTSFKIPDVYGVFKFVIDYRRNGLTHLELSQQVPVRHFKHNEFERFIVSAYPYYASAFSCMIGFLMFGFVFLYSRDKKN